MYLSEVINNVLGELSESVMQMTDEEYCARSVQLSGATMGQHVRHIIELFQCLDSGYLSGVVNYEKRKRDIRIESDRFFALKCIRDINVSVRKEDKPLIVEASFGTDDKLVSVSASYYRELVYNLEHAIHHMALIRVGINELTNLILPETFGVAPSTIQYRHQCAQ